MRIPLLITLIILAALQVQGQENPQNKTFRFNLQECLEYAYENQDSLKNARLDIESANYRVKETIGIGLPQVSGSAQFMDYLKIPQIPFPNLTYMFQKYLYDQKVRTENGTIPEPDDDPMSLIGFQQKYNANYNVNVSQLLFNGTYLVGLRASKTFKELSQKNYSRTKIATTIAVTKAYYQVLVSNEQLRLLDANLAQLSQQLKETTELNKQGFVEKIDLDRLRVVYNNLVTTRENTSNLLELSIQLLKFQIGMPVTYSLAVKDKIDNISLELNDGLVVDTTAYRNRIEYSLLETQRRLNQLDLDRIKSQALPSLAAIGSAGNAYQAARFGDLFDMNLPSVYIGLQLNVPIFSGFQRLNQVRQAKISVQKTDNMLNMAKNGFLLQQQQARTTYQNSMRALNNQKANMELAREVLRVSRIKYQEGVGSSIEVTQAQTELEQAENNYIQALYDVLVSKVDLDNAYGRIQ
ncbi:TolC family protein [Pedobacter sp. SYSU D00535]|uniref:TolC family protein n=1 Tax=Pedobacter sp. SYSU D00535 TaxID=2810308 RepID=UPI001A976FF4|nr:TolC family protein [Pedobacter sp. SYSU D00535]